MILLNPGPVTLSERVRRALLQEDLCHREPEFAQLTLDIKQHLLNIYSETADNYEAILLTGSGTCAMEAMLSSLIPREGKALVVVNGVYGDRMAKMIQLHGKLVETIISPWERSMDLVAIENHLQQDSTITHVVAVHHETTTGRLNNISQLGQLCQQFKVALLLDCVSSFGAETIDFTGWNIEACAATANKCLHGVPGLSFLLVKSSVFTTRPSAATTLYLDIYRYQKEQIIGYSPFTQAVHVSYALQEALKELAETGGWKARHQHYSLLSQQIRQGLQQLGVKLLLPEQDYSCILTSFILPENITYEKLHQSLKDAGFIIYAGQGNFKDRIFRVANMGDIKSQDIQRFLDCCAELLR
ncbi:MAG: 2-aminoethylphosphonate--pyruvate transaminase [Oscillatoria sp. PMC 1051.18]|nr:2-aminoethylphosphonate--pyruvate transaminase [Oscillatoria sp. PMC 1050.18]MEC5032375.1 2-aminoethylphosphonate--pyruvate transaminase [Oscillatoria sp. PMC 1051.18]